MKVDGNHYMASYLLIRTGRGEFLSFFREVEFTPDNAIRGKATQVSTNLESSVLQINIVEDTFTLFVNENCPAELLKRWQQERGLE